jgi:hypothetical protein
MKSEIKDQLHDFLVKFMNMQASTPPSQGNHVESVASNVAQVLHPTPDLGENSPTLPTYSASPAPPAFNLSVSPQSHIALPKPQASSSLRPQLHQKQNFPHPNQPQTPPNRTQPTPDSPQYGMPTYLWPLTQPSQSLSFQPPNTIPTPKASTFFQATNTYTQPILAYTQQQISYYYQYNQPMNPHYPQQWPHTHTGWLEPIPNHTTYH